MDTKRIMLLIPIALFLLTILAVGRNLRKPFVGIHDWNGARYGNIARNYLIYGFSEVKMGQVENSGEATHSEFRYLTHYPPLLPILISINYRIFGVSEIATRLVPLLVTAGAIILIYLIGRTIFNWEIGLIAALLTLATPMIRYFGKNPVHEPLALFFALISFLGAAYIIRKEERGWILVFLGLALTSLTNWSGIFLASGLSLIFFKKVPALKLIAIWFVVILMGGLHFFHVYILTGSPTGGGIFDAFLQRTSLAGDIFTSFTTFEFINRLRLWASTLFTLSLLSCALVGVYFLLKKGTKTQKVFLFSLLVYGGGHPLVFPNATFIHNYFIYGMVAFLGLLAAYAIYSIPKGEAVRIVLFLLIFLLVWFERRQYFLSLERSQGDFLAYQVGKELRSKVPKKDSVLVTPYNYGASRLPILAFYADREIVLKSDSMYNWIVQVDEKKEKFQLSCISGCSLKR